MSSTVKIPLNPPLQKGEAGGNSDPKKFPPLSERGARGDFHARGRQHFSVMNVYETIKVENRRKKIK